MDLFSKENVAALVAVVAGLGTYFLQRRWVRRRSIADARKMVTHLLEAHSDAKAVFDYLDRLCEAVSTRGRVRLATIVVERSVRNACERLARIDRQCAFRASEFLASLDLFERGLRRLEYLITQFIETLPDDGQPAKRHMYVRELICGQAQIAKKDRLTALEAEIQLLEAIPWRTPHAILSTANKKGLAKDLGARCTNKA